MADFEIAYGETELREGGYVNDPTDQAVATSVRYLQDGLNLLNRNGRNYADIEVDGKMGPMTLVSLKALLDLEKGQPDYLLKLLNIMQAVRYLEVMRNDPTQERFARGWLNRVDLR